MAEQRETVIPLHISGDNSGEPVIAHLLLETDKGYNGGICSSARVQWRGNHSAVTAYGAKGVNGDFCRTLHQTDPTVRATQKRIDTQHSEVFTPDVIKDLEEQAKARSLASPFFRPTAGVE